MMMVDGTALLCDQDCRCGGQHRKVAEIHGTTLEIVGRFSGHQTHQVSVSIPELMRLIAGTHGR